MDPLRSTHESPVIAWASPFKTAGFVENLDCQFGILGMDIIKKWDSATLFTVGGKLKIRIVTK